MRSPSLRNVLLALAVVAAGCSGEFSLQIGGLDTGSLEEEILTGLEEQLPVVLDRVECPSGIEPRAGDVFVCRVFADDGSVGTVEVEQRDAEGNVTWELTEVLGPDEQ